MVRRGVVQWGECWQLRSKQKMKTFPHAFGSHTHSCWGHYSAIFMWSPINNGRRCCGDGCTNIHLPSHGHCYPQGHWRECPEMRCGAGGKKEKGDWQYFPVCLPFFPVHHWNYNSFHSQKCPRLDHKLYNYPRGSWDIGQTYIWPVLIQLRTLKSSLENVGIVIVSALTHSWVKGWNVSIPQFCTSNCYKGYEFKWFLSLKLQMSPVKFPGLSGHDSTHLNYLPVLQRRVWLFSAKNCFL